MKICGMSDKLPELLPEALATIRQIQNKEYRAQVLSALADKLPELLPEAFAARQIQNKYYPPKLSVL